MDVTEECKVIGKTVRDLCTGAKRQTLLYISDVLKGSKSKKILSYKHEQTPYHAKLHSWTLTDIQRLLQKMVLDDYLKEELIFCRDIPHAYLRLGGRIDKLMSGIDKVDMTVKIENKTKRPEAVAKVVPAAASSATATNNSRLNLDVTTTKLIDELIDRCHNDLLDECRKLAAERDVTIFGIMNMQAIKLMSQKMPISKEEMLEIAHVTPANYAKYGQNFLNITESYAAQRLCK